jgi:hypothetical protein
MIPDGTSSTATGFFSQVEEQICAHQKTYAKRRIEWVRQNSFFYRAVLKTLRHLIPPAARLLNLRCDCGYLLNQLQPSHGVGLELTTELANEAQNLHPDCKFYALRPAEFHADEPFDYVLIGNLDDAVDIQQDLLACRDLCHDHSRVILYHSNILWRYLILTVEKMGWKVPKTRHNWLTTEDLINFLRLAGYEPLQTHYTVLCPLKIPVIASVINDVIVRLPLLRKLCLVQVLVARKLHLPPAPAHLTVSVIVPCKNERGTIHQTVQRMPKLGTKTEIVFCDDQSTDGTWEEMLLCQTQNHRDDLTILTRRGPGLCKAENVWTGFRAAQGDILVILDGDLTVMPEQLPYFVDALTRRHCEFANGSRLIYPHAKESMKLINMLGNRAFSTLFSFILGQPLRDTLCGTKALWRHDWKRLETHLGTWGIQDRWGDYELLFGAAKLSLKIVDIPVHYQERRYGYTKMVSVFSNGLRMLTLCLKAFIRLRA